MKVRMLLLLMAALPLVLSAQNEVDSNYDRYSYSVNQKIKLAAGVLLVRLETKQRKIDLLKEYGYVDEAEIVFSEQKMKNLEIVRSFTEDFTFCPSLFFYSDHSEEVLHKDFSSPFFLDSNLEIDESIKLSTENYLIAEFGNVQQDTLSVRDFYYQNGNKRKPSYWGSPNFHFGALVVMSDEFIQLRHPFPNYVRTFDSLPLFERAIDKTIKRLDKKLLAYSYF